MKPMAPLSEVEKWWPQDLGQPAASGSQNGARYAFFPEKHRLLIEREGKLTAYDSGEHHISGVSQASHQRQSLAFTGPDGLVRLGELKPLS
jgi:hypothetical protein